MTIVTNIAAILLAITSILLIGEILLHKGQGGGVSDMFGGGIQSSARASGVAAKNLNKITITTATIWVILIIVLALIMV